MDKLPELAGELVARSSTRLSLPEHRQIELYTRKKTLAVSAEERTAAGGGARRRRLHRLPAAAGRLRSR